MEQLFKFMSNSPFLTFFLACIIFGSAVGCCEALSKVFWGHRKCKCHQKSEVQDGG